MFDFTNLMNVSKIQLYYYIAAAVMFLLYRLFLCLSVYADGRERSIKGKNIWSIFAFLFGMAVSIIYAVCNHKKKDRASVKSKKLVVCIMIFSLMLSAIAGLIFELSFTGEFGFLDPDIAFDETSVVTFKDKSGRTVILDKMGNEYTYFQKDELMYYDENGNSYKCLNDTWSKVLNTQSGQIFSESDYDFYINDEGYLCIFDNFYELSEYENGYCPIRYDDEHLYYSLSDVCWNREGDVVFPQYIDEVNNITYEMAAGKGN